MVRVRTRGEDAHREVLYQRLEKLEAMLVVRLALDEVLEDAEHGRDLARGYNLLRASTEERSQEANERRNVPSALPKRGRKEGREEDLVRVGQVGRGRVEFEKLREDLEDEGRELRDVLLEDDVERREEGRLKGRKRGRVGGGDEAAADRACQLRVKERRARHNLPDKCGDALEREVVELGVRGVLADLAEDGDEVLQNRRVVGPDRLPRRDYDAHGGCEAARLNQRVLEA